MAQCPKCPKETSYLSSTWKKCSLCMSIWVMHIFLPVVCLALSKTRMKRSTIRYGRDGSSQAVQRAVTSAVLKWNIGGIGRANMMHARLNGPSTCWEWSLANRWMTYAGVVNRITRDCSRLSTGPKKRRCSNWQSTNSIWGSHREGGVPWADSCCTPEHQKKSRIKEI